MAFATPALPRKPAASHPLLAGRTPARGAGAQRDWQRGTQLMRQGELEQACMLFERAIRQAPGVALYWVNLANVQRKLKREGQALDSARRGFDLDRSSLVACHLLVELLRLHNRRDEALAALRELDPATERDADHWWLEGDLLFAMHRAEEAAQALLQVLTMQPGHHDAYMKLGFSLAWLKQYGAAAECFRTVTMMDPRQLGAAVYAVHYAAWACDWSQGRDDLLRMQQALGHFEGHDTAPPTSPFCFLAVADDPVQQLLIARREALRLELDLRRRVAWPDAMADEDRHAAARARLARGRCRVGFVACDFRDHATSILMSRVVELLDRQRFEVMLYSHGDNDGSPLRQRMEAAADGFVDCRQMSLAEQAERIRADGVALLIDLGGFTYNSRLQMFALRPAPVQASWLAFPGTVGAPWIDYIIGDPVVTPLASAGDFSEKIVQLPVCYQANDELREHPETTQTRSEAGLPEGGIVFACFNQSYKFTEECFDSWCRILKRVPGSVLCLLVPQAEVQQRLKAQAQHRGLNPQRLLFAPFVTQSEHLARLPLADICLDTFPCGAHTTCSDALWMGVPLITRMGESFASRVAASLLSAVGLEPLAVQTAAEFEEMAVRLAQDREALTDVRDHLWDNRRELPLFDSARCAADLGQACDRMIDRWQQGLAPAHLPAPVSPVEASDSVSGPEQHPG